MSKGPTSLLGLACRLRFGTADWRDVEAVGLQKLASGKTGPAIVALADVTASTELVDAAISAEAGEVADSATAAEAVAIEIAQRIDAGDVEPVAGARVLWRVAPEVHAVEPQLRVFIGLVSEWDDAANRSPTRPTRENSGSLPSAASVTGSASYCFKTWSASIGEHSIAIDVALVCADY